MVRRSSLHILRGCRSLYRNSGENIVMPDAPRKAIRGAFPMSNPLIQYLSSGIRRFKTMPILQHTRHNWEFYAVTQGRCGVLLDNDEKLPLRAKRLWVFPPNHLHGWHGGDEHCSVVVVHATSVPRQLAGAIPACGFLERRLTSVQCHHIEMIERAIESDFHNPNALSDLRFDRAIIDLSVIALGGVIARRSDSLDARERSGRIAFPALAQGIRLA